MEIQQEDVHTDLAEYLPSLRAGIADAVGKYNGYDAGLRRVHSKRSTASLIHDHIVENMARFAESAADVELRNVSNLWVLSFPQGYLIRFKKVGAAKLAAGHPTKQVKKVRNHQQLDGLPKAINLDLSYELDDDGMLRAVYLICPAGVGSNMWDSELVGDGARPIMVSLFGTPVEPQGATLLPKRKVWKNEAKSGDGDPGA
jgi:hypothetical protein